MSSQNKPIRILIVDDHDMLREGLSAFIRSFDDLDLVGEASSGEEGVRLCAEMRPDVVLMDLVMPGMGGVEAIKAIHQTLPGVAIIVLSSFGDEKLVKEALQNGATSYLLKTISASKLAEAIRTTVSGLPTLAPEVAHALIDSASMGRGGDRAAGLTPRELEVLDLIAKGMSNQEIAQRLKLSIFTVKNHVSNILSKLEVSSRAEAVVWRLRAE